MGKKLTAERKPTTTTTAFLPLPDVDTISNIQTSLTLRLGRLASEFHNPHLLFLGRKRSETPYTKLTSYMLQSLLENAYIET